MTAPGHRCALAAVLVALAGTACGASTPPNVVIVTLDTTRADHLGLYGYYRDTSPRLDAFGGESIVFDRAIAPMATTLPTHLSLFTATHPLEHGVLANRRRRGRRWTLAPSLRSFAQACREAGLRTGAFVSAAPLRAGTGIELGFETYDEPPGDDSRRNGRLTTTAALRWLDGIDEEPFLLWVHYYDAHWPLAPPRALAAEFSTDERLEAWLSERQVWEHTFYEGVPVGDPRKNANLYAAAVRYQDTQLGRLLDALAARPDWPRTALLVVADHGEGLSQHGEAAHGRTWNEQLHVPLLMRVPGEPPRRETTLLSVVDALPTFLGLLRFDALEPFLAQASGRDVLGEGPAPGLLSLDGGDILGRPGYRNALTTELWKYYRTEIAATAYRHQLFDLTVDPFELRDVAAEQPEVVARLGRLLAEDLEAKRERGRSLASAPETEPPLDPALAEQLRELGYAGEEPDGG